MKAEELMSKKLITIDVNEPIRNALKLMKKKNVSRLLVRKDKNIIGILTERDLARRLGSEKERKLSDAHIHVSSCYQKKLITVKKETKVKDVARIMIENGISSVPVRDDSKIVGIVTKTDLLKLLKDSKVLVKEIMNKNVRKIEDGSRLLEARKMMLHYGIKRLLVVRDNKLVGIITESDIARALGLFRKVAEGRQWDERMRNIFVNEIMQSKIISISPNDSIAKCVKLMEENDISGLPVLEGEEIKGIITKTDLVKIISEK